MKTLQKNIKTLYRFRCECCGSKFEMTENEKRENDIKHTKDWAKQLENEKKFGMMPTPFNQFDHFYCPICNEERAVRHGEMHKYLVMDDGTEIQRY